MMYWIALRNHLPVKFLRQICFAVSLLSAHHAQANDTQQKTESISCTTITGKPSAKDKKLTPHQQQLKDMELALMQSSIAKVVINTIARTDTLQCMVDQLYDPNIGEISGMHIQTGNLVVISQKAIDSHKTTLGNEIEHRQALFTLAEEYVHAWQVAQNPDLMGTEYEDGDNATRNLMKEVHAKIITTLIITEISGDVYMRNAAILRQNNRDRLNLVIADEMGQCSVLYTLANQQDRIYTSLSCLQDSFMTAFNHLGSDYYKITPKSDKKPLYHNRMRMICSVAFPVSKVIFSYQKI